MAVDPTVIYLNEYLESQVRNDRAIEAVQEVVIHDPIFFDGFIQDYYEDLYNSDLDLKPIHIRLINGLPSTFSLIDGIIKVEPQKYYDACKEEAQRRIDA